MSHVQDQHRIFVNQEGLLELTINHDFHKTKEYFKSTNFRYAQVKQIVQCGFEFDSSGKCLGVFKIKMEDPGVGLPFILDHRKPEGTKLFVLQREFLVHSVDGEYYDVIGKAEDFDHLKMVLEKFKKGEKKRG
jgi:hypothetical protein